MSWADVSDDLEDLIYRELKEKVGKVIMCLKKDIIRHGQLHLQLQNLMAIVFLLGILRRNSVTVKISTNIAMEILIRSTGVAKLANACRITCCIF